MDFLTEDELAIGRDDPRFKPKSQRGATTDVALGFISGVAMGTVEVATAPDALIRGDKKAAALRAQNLTVFKPEDLGTAGELTYGLTNAFTRIGWNALGTIGTGGYFNLGAQAGLFGAQSYEAEKSDLINKGADIETAKVGGAIRGISDTVGYLVPVKGVANNVVADAIATTGLAMASGAAGDYIEGDYLQQSSNKKVKEYGEQLEENSLSPTSLGANGTMALMLNLYANKAKLRPEQTSAHQAADDLTHAAQVEANIDHADGLNPFTPETAKDANTHFYNLDQAMEQALSDERISLDLPVTGAPKAAPVPKKIIRPLSFKGKNANTKQKIYDTTIARGLNDSEARAVLAISHFETGGSFDPNITNKSSGFKGIGQFKPSTWRAEGGTDANYTDLNKQIEILVKHTKNNIEYIKKETGVTLTGSQIYLPHLLGRGGAKAIMRAIRDTPNAKAETVLRRVYKEDTQAVLKGNAINPDDSIQDAMSKFTSKIDRLIAKEYGGDINNNGMVIRGSDSDFPDYEMDIAQTPEYKRESDILIEASPSTFVSRFNENEDIELELELNFKRLEEPLNQDDFEYLKATAHYQPYDNNVNRVPYVEPQLDASSSRQSAQRNLNDLESELQDPVLLSAANDSAPVKTVIVEKTDRQNIPDEPDIQSGRIEQAEAPSVGIENWRATRSDSYLKREMNQSDGITTQDLYHKPTDTLYQRQVLSDGTVSAVKVSRSGQDVFARLSPDDAVNEKLTSLQNKAAQALEREFWKPSREQLEGTPDLLGKSETLYGSFEQTPDGREAIRAMVDNPDMEVTVNRINANGDDEVVSMSARDWLDYIREQEETAKDEIQAVKALASCALKFGSQAA